MEQIQSMEFTRALGLRTQVTVNDCISLLHHLGDRKQPFEARYSLAEELGTITVFLSYNVFTYVEVSCRRVLARLSPWEFFW
jgi:hypothetical protein